MRWNRDIWSVLKEIREYGWEKKPYLWVKTNIARLRYSKYIVINQIPKHIWSIYLLLINKPLNSSRNF